MVKNNLKKLNFLLSQASTSAQKGKSGGVVELTKATVVGPRDLGSNLSSDKKYFLILFVSHFNPNL